MCYVLPIVNDILTWYDQLFEQSGQRGVFHEGLVSLVLVPTRELAIQVHSQFRKVSQNQRWKVKTEAIIGGLSKQKQERLLNHKPHILVATPGRLLDIINESSIEFVQNLKSLKHLVLDEADRILELGLLKDVEQILFSVYATNVTDPNFKKQMDQSKSKKDKTKQENMETFDEEESKDENNVKQEEAEEAPKKNSKKGKKSKKPEESESEEENNSQYYISMGGSRVNLNDFLKNNNIKMLTPFDDDDEEGDAGSKEPEPSDEDSKDQGKMKGKQPVQQDLSGLPKLLDVNAPLRTIVLSATITKAFLSSRMTKFRDRMEKTLFKKAKQKGKKYEKSTEDENKKLKSLFDQIKFQNEVKVVDLTKETLMPAQLQKFRINTTQIDKMVILNMILQQNPSQSFIVFTNSIIAAKKVAAVLNLLKIGNQVLHSELQQRQRLKRLDRFKEKKVKVLVATDVASRGLDIPNVDCVVHYELPSDMDTYVHRCGRTARIGNEGKAFVMLCPKDLKRHHWIVKEAGEFESMQKVDYPVQDYVESSKILL